MAKLKAKKKNVKPAKGSAKKAGKKGVSKGVKLLLFVFALAVVTVVLSFVIKSVNDAMVESKTIPVLVDMELGTPGDGPGQFKEPQAVAVDPRGGFYVSDFSGHRIQKFDPNGAPLSSIGKEGKGDGEFEQPSGIYADGQGDLYVCDTFNHRIQKFDGDGNFVKSWAHGFFGPRSIVGTSQNKLYVSDTGNHKIQVFDMDGNFIQEWGGFGTADGKFREPVGVTADPQGNVYVADSDNLRIQKFDGNGKFIAAFKISSWRGKNDETPYLAFGNGFLYASNASKNAVLKLDAMGKLVAICTKKDKEGFSRCAGVAVNSEDRVYVVEKGTGKVARFTVPLAPVK